MDFDDGPEPAPAVPPEVISQGADEQRPAAYLEKPRRHLEKRTRDLDKTPPSRSLPHSAEAEEHVLACCLLDGDSRDETGALSYQTLTRTTDAGIYPPDFYFPANRLLFDVMLDLRTRQLPVNLEILAEELNARRQLEAVGGFPYLMQVTAKVPTTAHAGYMIEKVREQSLRRLLIREATGIVESAYNGTDLPDLLSLAERLKPAEVRQKTDYTTRRVTVASKPAEPKTRLFLAKKPIATPGNLVSIISKAKTGKTAAIGGVVAAIIGAHYDRGDLDTLGFTAPHTKEAVILIDTEQSPYDAYTCHLRAFARAKQEADVDWLCHYALVGYGAQQLRTVLPKILSKAKADHGAVFTIILDGVADFVESVNDEGECNSFISYLRSIAVDYDCPIICVIHSNEAVKAGDDGRGHLGKQLTRKSESNLLLRKTGEVTVITSEKQRKAPITEADGVAFEWSDEQQRHVSCGTVAAAPSGLGRPPKYDAAAMLSCAPGPQDRPMPLNQIYRLVKELPCGISDRAFKDWAAKWVQTGELVRVGDAKLGFGFRRGRE